MNRLLRSLAKSLRAADSGANRGGAARRRPSGGARPVLTEGLESRVLMAANLSGGMLNKFNIPTNAAGTGYQPGIVTAAGGGANGPSSTSGGDDTIERAKRKSLPFTEDNAQLSHGLDVDMYRFTAKRNQRVTFDIDRPLGSQVDTVIRVFNAAGQEIAVNDDGGAFDEPDTPNLLESYLDFTFSVRGTYYLGVSGAFNDGYNAVTGANDVMSPSTGRYILRAQNYVNPDPNDTLLDPDDTVLVTPASSVSDVISFGTDVDMFAITVTAGMTLGFDIDPDPLFPNTPLDSILRLFDQNGTELAISDDDDAPGEMNNPPQGQPGPSYFEYTFLQDGTYFVGVSGKGNDAYDPVTGDGDTPGSELGNYTLFISLL